MGFSGTICYFDFQVKNLSDGDIRIGKGSKSKVQESKGLKVEEFKSKVKAAFAKRL